MRTYTRRPAPADPSRTKGFLDRELQNISRAISQATDLWPYALQPGEVGVVSESYPVGDIRRYGALSGGLVAADTAIANTVTSVNAIHANGVKGVPFIIPEGLYLAISPVVLDLPDDVTLVWYGTIQSSVNASTAVQIGPTSSRTAQWYQMVGAIDVRRPSIDHAGSSVGVEFRNVSNSKFWIRQVYGYTTNVLVNSTYPGGTAYNQFFLGWMIDGVTTLRLTASDTGDGPGFTNENNFFGGSWSRTSSFPNGTIPTDNLVVDHYAVNVLNNNRFYSPSFEDNSLLARAAFIDGQFILIVHPRMENTAMPGTYPLEFGANSQECQVLATGAGLDYGCIVDNGTANSYYTRRGQVIKSLTAIAGQAIVESQSVNSSGAYGFATRDTAGTVCSWMRCDGIGYAAEYYYAQKGVRFNASNPSDPTTYDQRGLFSGTGDPNGVVTARMGSLYTSAGGGAGVTWWVKESGDNTDTGWVAK